MKAKVTVAHPGAQHSHHLASALQELGFLQQYVTGLYTDWNQRPFSYLGWLPQDVRQQLQQRLFSRFRRAHAKLDSGRVRAIQPFGEILLAIGRRVGLPATWSSRLEQASSLKFQRDLARLVQRTRADALVCYDKNAFEAFSRLEDKGIWLLLDQSTAHPAFHERILAEERGLSPGFADSIVLPSEKSPWFGHWCREAQQADYVLAGSRFVKETLLAEGISDEKVHVVNYGVDVEQFRPRPEGARDGKFVLLFAGAIMQRKGISYLLEARSRLSLRDLELVLCGGIAGSGNGLKPYAGTFRHIGHTPHATMPAIYQQADVFVLPSLVEGLSLVLLEALASGLPVITTPNSGAMGLIEDGVQGFIVPIRDPDAIAERIAFLHGNPDRCREMGKAARRLALKHSWKRYGQELNHLFGQLLG